QHATANERLAAEVAERRRIELALRVSQEEDRRFQERLVALLEISSELSHTESVDDLFRRAVELGRARLGFDRLSIWLLHPDGRTATGTYGTDESGRLRDERCQRVSLKLLGDETLTLRRACLKF